MLLFSLGPVQSFIAQARKTRDLWLGSFLLSALMQAGMQDITEHLIFPANPNIEGNIPDLPNKYIALFDTAEAAREAAQQSEERIKEFWLNICQDIWQLLFSKIDIAGKETHKQWNGQINPDNLFEIYWIVTEETGKDYADWLSDTQYLFDRRKHLRAFKQQEEQGEKSTISGQRAALRGTIPDQISLYSERAKVSYFWKQVTENISSRDISKDGVERLDAIDTVKRFAFQSPTLQNSLKTKTDSDQNQSANEQSDQGKKKDQTLQAAYPSTSSIAAASYVEQLLRIRSQPAVSNALAEWYKSAKSLGENMPAAIPLLVSLQGKLSIKPDILELDGDCYFRPTFSEQRLQKDFKSAMSDPQRARLAREAPRRIRELIDITSSLTPAITPPTPYYAMIQMDGDKMGKLINHVQSLDEHKNISAALSKFARKEVPPLVEEHYPGRLIYAGGDDAVALASLARNPNTTDEPDKTDEQAQIMTVLELVYRLQQKYQETVRDAVEGEERKETVTASTGIAIAHHYSPLSYVRRIASEAEKLAKHHYGRNALVVTVLRRSGEQTRVGCHWHYDGLEEGAQPIPLFRAFYDYFAQDKLSPKCIYNLLDEAPTLVTLGTDAECGENRGAQCCESRDEQDNKIRDARCSEIRRILFRQSTPELTDEWKDELSRRACQIVALAQAMDNAPEPRLNGDRLAVELHAEGRRHGLIEVLGWLLVMIFLTRKEQE